MTLRARLAVGLAIIAIVLIVPLVIARQAMIALYTQVVELRDNEVSTSISLGSLRDALQDVRAREVTLGVIREEKEYRELLDAIRVARGWADSVTATFTDSTTARSIRSRLDQMAPIADEEYAAYRAGLIAKGDSISSLRMGPVISEAERALKYMGRQIDIMTQDRVDNTGNKILEAQQAALAGLVIAVLIATLIGIWLMRSISGPVTALEKGMRAVADGDLQHQLELSPKRRDEFGRLAASFRTMSTQLAELDKLKAEFVSVASHELKTPINVILGYLQLMQDGIYGPVSKKQAEILETIEAQGRTLARLSAQLLDVTRFEAGGGRIEPRTLHLATLLDQLERAFHVLAVQRGVELRVTLSDGLPDEVQWDPDRITCSRTPSSSPAAAARSSCRLHRRTVTCRSPCATPERASPPPSFPTSSRSSTRPTTRGPRRRPAPASAWRSPRRSSKRTAARSAATAWSAKARRSRFSCRRRCTSAGARASIASSSSRPCRDPTARARPRPGAAHRLGLSSGTQYAG
jgi:signal transduction histidine kinase